MTLPPRQGTLDVDFHDEPLPAPHETVAKVAEAASDIANGHCAHPPEVGHQPSVLRVGVPNGQPVTPGHPSVVQACQECEQNPTPEVHGQERIRRTRSLAEFPRLLHSIRLTMCVGRADDDIS